MGVLRATPSRLVLLRSWKVDLKRISFRVDGSAGMTYQGAGAPRVHATHLSTSASCTGRGQ